MAPLSALDKSSYIQMGEPRLTWARANKVAWVNYVAKDNNSCCHLSNRGADFHLVDLYKVRQISEGICFERGQAS